MNGTKTTLYLPTVLHVRLKAMAGRSGTTISALLAEGAELALARRQGAADREELLRRAREAEEALRDGLYRGPAISRDSDRLVYSGRGKRRPARGGA